MVAPRRTVARPNRAGFSAMTDAPMGPGGPRPTAPAQPMPMQRPIDQIPPPLQTQSQFNQPQPLSQFQQAPLQPAPTGLGIGTQQAFPLLAAPTAPSPQQNQALFQLQQQQIDKMRAQLGSAITPQQQAALQQAQAELEKQRTTGSFGPQPPGSVAPPQQFPNIGVPNPQMGMNPVPQMGMNPVPMQGMNLSPQQTQAMLSGSQTGMNPQGFLTIGAPNLQAGFNPQQIQNLNNLYQQKFGPQPQTAPPVQLQQLPSLAMPMQPQGQFNQPQPMQTQAQLNQRPMDQMRAQTQQNMPFQTPQPAQPMGGMQNNQQQTPQQRPGQPNMGNMANRGGGGVM